VENLAKMVEFEVAVAVAVIGGLFGGGLTSALAYWREKKSGRETWENWRRGGYGVLLNRLDEYGSITDVGKWQQEYRHARARNLLSGSDAVADLLLKKPLNEPNDPNGLPLLNEEQYNELVEAMRADVSPKGKRRKGDVPPSAT
jgi:hypothetical protein